MMSPEVHRSSGAFCFCVIADLGLTPAALLSQLLRSPNTHLLQRPLRRADSIRRCLSALIGIFLAIADGELRSGECVH